MMYSVSAGDLEWEQHPAFAGVEIKVLHSKKNHDSQATIVITKVPAGGEVPWHIHTGSDDILYVLEGSATMEIQDVGTFAMTPGVCIRVPGDVRHRIINVVNTFLIYDVFAPATI